MFAIIGVVIVLGAVMGGFLMEHGNPSLLWQPAEFVIILGAAFGGFLIATPSKAVKFVIGRAFGVFKGSRYSKQDYLEILMLLSQIFYKIRKQGLVAVEEDVDRPAESPIFRQYPKFMSNHHAVDFVTDTLRTVISTTIEPHELESLMDTELESYHEELVGPAKSVATVADSLPGLGIVAAVLGVVLTMQKIGEPPEVLGHSVGAALVGTFLGVLACYGFVGPMSKNMEYTAAEEIEYVNVLKIALKSFISNNAAPQVAIEFGRRVIPAGMRPSYIEVENSLRQVKK
ncbi:MAG: flagellar motor stator protein MotA [Syntrophales bacterium]|nr:flagellar motor stator protein MotA [Syntrophales bacterium]MDD5232735.1 flagellar motor stator protein MotA [Syntrophales bacterium]MDD5531585.1 flagellar motor stator protein MotA [Syntrophales bacterium]HPL63169.1 flagellar motor stator protein MotA [Syntrophales bacterium]